MPKEQSVEAPVMTRTTPKTEATPETKVPLYDTYKEK